MEQCQKCEKEYPLMLLRDGNICFHCDTIEWGSEWKMERGKSNYAKYQRCVYGFLQPLKNTGGYSYGEYYKHYLGIKDLLGQTLDNFCGHCKRAGNFKNVLVKTICSNGSALIYFVCSNCYRRFDDNINYDTLSRYNIEKHMIPIRHDYRDETLVCSFKECNNNEVEYHHWGPKHIFKNDSDKWPGSYLCKYHHNEWHNRVTKNMYTKFPEIGHVTFDEV